MPCNCSRAKAHAAPLPPYRPAQDAPPDYSETGREPQPSADPVDNESPPKFSEDKPTPWPAEKEEALHKESSSPPREGRFKRFFSKMTAHETASLHDRMHTSSSHLSNDVTRAL